MKNTAQGRRIDRKNHRDTAKLIALTVLFFGLWNGLPRESFAADEAQKPSATSADDTATQEKWALHGQMTNVTQSHRGFTSPYSGQNSFIANGRTEETTDLTLYTGVRLWRGAELWLNPEIDQGFGLSNTVGMAGFPSGEAYKIGANSPYVRLPRAFIRQVIPLGGAQEKVEPAANQLGG